MHIIFLRFTYDLKAYFWEEKLQADLYPYAITYIMHNSTLGIKMTSYKITYEYVMSTKFINFKTTQSMSVHSK